MSLRKIAHFVREEVLELNAYHVPDASNLIKLDNMENPYGWEPSVVDEWLQKIREVPLNRYPDPEAKTLQTRLRDVMSIPADAGLILGNGSDELIQIICMSLAKPGAAVLSVDPSFVMYKMLSKFTGMSYHSVALNDDFSLPVDTMLARIEEIQPAVIYLAYPNNPTGNLFDEDAICKVIEASPGLVVIDEAYYAFADNSFAKYLDRYENMMVMRTVSKMGLAGLRLGYMMGNPAWINEFNKVRMPFNINALTQVSADFALEHVEMLDKQTKQICEDREKLFAEMSKIEGIVCYPSKANFILFKVENAVGVYQSLQEKGVLIRNLSSNGGSLTDCLRVTIGAEYENEAFIKALQESL